jgi:hypothetical protein
MKYDTTQKFIIKYYDNKNDKYLIYYYSIIRIIIIKYLLYDYHNI